MTNPLPPALVSEAPREDAMSVVAAHDPSFVIFYVPKSGWVSTRLGFHEGIGPYLSLRNAVERAEAEIGHAVWRPCGTALSASRTPATTTAEEK